ncbi:MAG TPA: hypothetical protein VGG25_29020 [Streptosporangiaceae bacterium]|jgi:hypothetical protein
MYGVRAFGNLLRPARLALPLAAGLALAGLLPSAAGAVVTPAATVKVKVDGLNRAGKVVSVAPSLISVSSGFRYFSDGGAIRLPAGTYLVGGSVLTYNSSRQAVSQTLVVRRVTITKSETVRLDGQHGKLVRVGLAASGATQRSLSVLACLEPSAGSEISVSASGGQGVAVYAVPSRHAGVMFTYLSDWQSPSAEYQLSGNRHNGIPSVLSFRPSLTSLAKIDLVMRANETPAGDLFVQADPNGGNTVCQSGAGIYSNVTAPSATTVYRTPGSWLTAIEVERGGDGTGYIYRTRTYRAGHSYADRFLTAGYGPRDIIPAMEGDLFNADVSNLFADPVARGDNCCDKSVVSLRQGGHLIKKQDRSEWREHNVFSLTLHKRGWYTLTINSRKWSPHGAEPASLLSSRVILVQRFYAVPVPPNGVYKPFGGTNTLFQPRGLSTENSAVPGARTSVVIHVLHGGTTKLRSVEVQESGSGGKTWHRLRLTRGGSGWQGVITDPASGFVSLRSTVKNVKGDSTVETVYHAYGIS